jgi:hypothetical protein
VARGQAGKTRVFGTTMREPLARNSIATAAAGDVVLLRTMAGADQLDTSLEALSNLLYLIRRTLNDPARSEACLNIVDKVLADIAANRTNQPSR